ncbi:glutamate 5-kinase [Sphingosinicella sp. CPCC 101087]|uniref:glutamate 5-kinase n=1 Tax=Sphingosinicella sp. CPCC 101087 TaxID=2497754 RepID=UPI001FB04E5E|nr:glutamate 5-kinase [Sphingosinicella sp. CPCC 101087]
MKIAKLAGEGQAPATPAALIAASRRVVVKVGSSLFIDPSGRGARRAWLRTLAADLAGLRGRGKEIVLVSSGAVALGRAYLGMKRSDRLDRKQAAAAAGQGRLMQAWERALAPYGLRVAQLLLTYDDTEQRRRWLNARATIEMLLAREAIPVINENDSVATEELRYGDNDRLSARAAQMTRADLLILLSDVDGLYTADPARDPGATHIGYVGEINARVEAFAGDASAGGPGTGGMRTKLAAARIASAAGCATLIASGRGDHPLRRLEGEARGTVVAAHGSPGRAYKQWIAGTLATAGSLVVDSGAVRALALGRSLLPAGVVAVDGEFERGACLAILDAEGREIGRGLCAYGSADARLILGAPSERFEDLLGWRGPDELIHRDDLVMHAR